MLSHVIEMQLYVIRYKRESILMVRFEGCQYSQHHQCEALQRTHHILASVHLTVVAAAGLDNMYSLAAAGSKGCKPTVPQWKVTAGFVQTISTLPD